MKYSEIALCRSTLNLLGRKATPRRGNRGRIRIDLPLHFRISSGSVTSQSFTKITQTGQGRKDGWQWPRVGEAK